MAERRDRRRLCKFLSSWTLSDQFNSWLTPVKGDNHKAYCLLCKKVFAVSHGGLNDVKAHYKGKRHIWLQVQRQQETETAEDSSNLWEGHQNFRSQNSGNNIVFNERTGSFEEVTNTGNSQSSSSIDGDTLGYDSSDYGAKYWELNLDPETVQGSPRQNNFSTPPKNNMNPQLKMLPQQYCLRWKYHHNNLQVMFSQLLERESYCDVTIACEGKTIRAHKMVLSACSTYFDAIFSQHEEKNPIVILKDVRFSDIKALIEFMYKGEINVDNSHLASLLKTAEDLHIKGLAEVSWRSDKNQAPAPENDINFNNGSEGQYSVDAMRNGSESEPPIKRRRARPVEEDNFNPVVMSVTGAAGTENAFTEDMVQPDDEIEEAVIDDSEPEIISDTEEVDQDPLNDTEMTNTEQPREDDEVTTPTPTPMSEENNLQRISSQYPDVIQLNDYLTTGRRQQFWEEPFTRRVMEAIKGKELEMKVGAELLGVSYGTLYGRYRDAYGCLKHPYRVRDFWSESGPADVLAKVQRKEITLVRAAEMLNVSQITLANYLGTLRQPGINSDDDADNENGITNPRQGHLNEDNGDDIEDDNLVEEGGSKTDPLESTAADPVHVIKEEPKTNHEHNAIKSKPEKKRDLENSNSDDDSDNGEVNGTDNELAGAPR